MEDKKIKVFVSVPMKGRAEEEIREHINRLYHNEVDLLVSEPELAVTKESFELIDTYITETPPPNKASKYWYRQKSLEMLFDADIVVFGKGYDDAVGCIMELQTAQFLGKKIKFE